LQLKLGEFFDRDTSKDDLGRMDVECSLCHALHWKEKVLILTQFRDSLSSMYCDHGCVQLPELLHFPPILSNLVSRVRRNHFLRYATTYNSAL
jgi:hypothetical protein